MLPANGQNVKLGKGSMLLNALNAAGNRTGFDFVGNATAIEISAEVTKSEIYSSTQQSAPLLDSRVTRSKFTVTMTLSEFQLSNLNKFLLGESNVKTQIVGTNATASFSGDDVVPGRYLDVGARRITNVTVTRDTTDPMVVDVDYIVYASQGMVKIVEGGSILAGDSVVVEFDKPALTIDQVRIGKVGTTVCHMVYLADDANNDGVAHEDRLEIWKVAVSPEGALPLVSDDYATFQLTAEVLSDSANHPNDPFGTLDRIR